MSELQKKFEENFQKAVETGRWMAAVWSVDGEVLFLNGVTTHDFPTGDLKKSVEMLQAKIQEMEDKPGLPVEEPEPLPAASLQPWLDRKPVSEEASEASPQAPSTGVENGIKVEVEEVKHVG